MPTDTERLDWLETKGEGRRWVARISTTGRGYRLITSTATPNYETAREAIDAAMSEVPRAS
jgi:hypothetical protein